MTFHRTPEPYPIGTYDETVDAFAVDFVPIGAGMSKRQRPLLGDFFRLVDYDADDRIISVEFLDASQGIDLVGVPHPEVVARIARELGLPVRN